MLRVILSAGLITSFFLLVLFLFLFHYGMPIEEIRTIMFVGISLDALFFAFSFKSLRQPLWRVSIFNNLYMLLALAASFALLVGAVYFAPVADLLDISRLTLLDFGLLVLIGLFNLLTIEFVKYVFIRRTNDSINT